MQEGRIVVPNAFPTVEPTKYRLAIVGEAPGKDEEQAGRPFVGMSGRKLDMLLSSVNISKSCCFVGNVMQRRPPTKKNQQLSPLDKWTRSDQGDLEAERMPALTEGLFALRSDLSRFKPHLVLLLGKTALWAAGKSGLDDWRGSLFLSDYQSGGGTPLKCLATYHPAAVLRQYNLNSLIQFDFRRAAKECLHPDLILPIRNLATHLSYEETIQKLDLTWNEKKPISCDIEGGVGSLSCLSIASSPFESYIIPFATLQGDHYWSLDHEVEIWRRVACIMADPQIKKVWQNGLYDRFVLQYSYGIVVKGNADDTMLKHWEQYCEMEKSLGFQASIYTEQPFYKFGRKATDQQEFFKYCCTDSAITYEINSKLTPCLSPAQQSHYNFNLETLNPLLYMELRGIRYDDALAKERLRDMQIHVYREQAALDQEARRLRAIEGLCEDKDLITQIQEALCYKKDPERPKKGNEAIYNELINDLATTVDANGLSLELRGKIAVACDATMNIKSHKKFQHFLYTTCGLPTQWKKDPATKEMRPTTDYEALLKLTKNHSHPVLSRALELSRLRTREQMLSLVSINNRVHCSYNLVGSETGRVTTSKSSIPLGDSRVGMNMQTVPDDWDMSDPDHPLTQGMRDLMVADEDCYLAKCDLKGADGWTVGAYMAMLGDPTMLDDLKFGLKPAQIVAYILKHGATNIQLYAKDRNKLKELVSEIKKDDWEYFVSKQGIWGTCYTMGPRKLAERVFIESDGKVNLSERQAKDFQAAIFIRYSVKLWQSWMQRFLDGQTYPAKLSASNGFTRRFFGRSNEILGEALAHLPQVYTTAATLMALHRLWLDPENRTTDYEECPIKVVRVAFLNAARSGFESLAELANNYKCFLKVEPMHFVHDELVEQWRRALTAWAIDKTKQWFNNPMQIAGQTITIPFDGAYGTAWSMDEHHKIGSI